MTEIVFRHHCRQRAVSFFAEEATLRQPCSDDFALSLRGLAHTAGIMATF